MYHRAASQPDPSPPWPEMYSPETLRSIGTQVEALVSRHSSLESHKQAIERQMESETTPQAVFASLAATSDVASFQCEINQVIALLEQANRPGWFKHLFLHRSIKKMRTVEHRQHIGSRRELA